MKNPSTGKLRARNALPRQFGEGCLEPGGDDFSATVKLFLRSQKLREIRSKTSEWYVQLINQFHYYLKERKLPTAPIDITQEIVEDYLLYVREHGNKPVSVNGKIRALRGFFNFLEGEKMILENPMRNIKFLRDVQHVVPTFTEEQIWTLLEQPDRSTLTGARDYMLMLLLLDTGARITETLSLKRQDVTWHNRLPVAIVLRKVKGKRERNLPLSPKVQMLFREFIQLIKTKCPNSDYIFVSVDGEELHRRTIEGRFTQYGKSAALKGVRVSPHTFRHTFAKLWIMANGDILSLQEILGHADLDMVKNYAKMFNQDIEKKHARFSPIVQHNFG